MEDNVHVDELQEYYDCINLLSEWKKITNNARSIIFSVDPEFRKETLSLAMTQTDEKESIINEYLQKILDQKLNLDKKDKKDFRYIPPPPKVIHCIDLLKSTLIDYSSKGGNLDVDKVLDEKEK